VSPRGWGMSLLYTVLHTRVHTASSTNVTLKENSGNHKRRVRALQTPPQCRLTGDQPEAVQAPTEVADGFLPRASMTKHVFIHDSVASDGGARQACLRRPRTHDAQHEAFVVSLPFDYRLFDYIGYWMIRLIRLFG
jgi:hypothetical protein